MNKLKNIISRVNFIALTTDLWKNKKKKYFLALTTHFFDDQLNYRSVVFGFRKFGKNHSSENIKSFIRKELGEEMLNKVPKCVLFCQSFIKYILKQIVSVTTDNEASIKRACSELSENVSRLSCMAHNLNLVVHRSLNLWKKPKK